MIDEKVLDKLMEFATREEQRAFLSGVKFATTTTEQPKPIPTEPESRMDQPPLKPSLGVTLSFQSPETKGQRHQPNRGIGSDMMRMLWTGPVSTREFVDQLMPRYERAAIRKSIRDLVRKGDAAESKENPGLYTITVAGRQRAQYFVHHNGAKSVSRNVNN